MKRFIEQTAIAIGIFVFNASLACDVCSQKQPAITRNLVHGVGPESDWDWFIVDFIILLTLVSFFLSVKYLFKPGEKDKDHIKYSLFKNN